MSVNAKLRVRDCSDSGDDTQRPKLRLVAGCGTEVGGKKSEITSDAAAPTPVYSGRNVQPKRSQELTEPILPRLAAGDSEAAAECLQRYSGLVWSLARRHTKSTADAEDAVQEIFIDLWKSAARFDASKAAEATFITMIARRRLIDRHRYAQRRPQTDPINPEVNPVPDVQHRQLEAYAEASLAARAIEQLDPKERNVVLLSAYHGMSHGQIAEHTGLPLGTVKTYISRGLMRVREMLKGKAASLQGANP